MPMCALCKQEAPIRVSHIIPAFVFRWLRETSATGFLWSAANPRVRVQDGLKVPMLCEECEQRFSRLERQFANDVFYPMQRENTQEVEYGRWFLKFCVSISWRILTYALQEGLLDYFSETQRHESDKALARWAQFLLEEVAHPACFEQRLVLLGAIESFTPYRPLAPNTNRYFLRGIDIDVGASKHSAFTFAKIGPFALFGMVQSCEKWQGAKINANAGTVGPRAYVLPLNIIDYWMDRARYHAQIYKSIPAARLDRINAEILLNPDRFINSGTFRAMEQDVDLFGRAAFWNR